MQDNPLKKLYSLGQSVWLDFISRELIASGKLKTLLSEDSVVGMTSNPSIFEQAIAKSEDYDEEIRSMAKRGMGALAIYEALSQRDVQSAADEFLQIYRSTGRKDGYVSLEVNPHLAYELDGTIEEARRFWKLLDRPNIMIKVPATEVGLKAIEQLTYEGINVNVTLIFSVDRYEKVAQAYLKGLQRRAEEGLPIDGVHSVASFFISRIDTSVDGMLTKVESPKTLAQEMLGKIAVASAKAAYKLQKELYAKPEFSPLAKKGASVQRLLWASTSTKNPKYSDVKYVEELIGAETVNTIPTDTLNLYRDHGQPVLTLEKGTGEAIGMLAQLKDMGIDMEDVADALEKDGVQKFNKSFDDLIAAIKTKMAK